MRREKKILNFRIFFKKIQNEICYLTFITLFLNEVTLH